MAQRSSAAAPSIEFVEDLKRRWMSTVDAIVDPLMLIDKNFRIIQANKALASHAGQEIKSIVGKTCYQVFAKRKDPCPGCKLKESFGTQQPQSFSLDQVLPNQYFEASSQPIFDGKGILEGSLHIYRDRTKAKRMESQLLQHEKLASIGLLAGGIAHELNNPLAGILLFSQMLMRTMDKESEHYQDVIEIELAANRCKTIVENLLDFARKQPTVGSPLETFDLKEVVVSALRFSMVKGGADAVQIQEVWASSTPIKANRNRLVQVFLNLIQNAIQSMPRGGRLSLKTMVIDDQGQQWCVAEVKDTGVGIPKDALKKIFDPFYTSKAENEGTGLGLSICHGILQEISGRIEVSSQLNKGSCFRVLIPMNSHP